MMTEQPERWKGRHSGKDLLRQQVWGALASSGAAIGNPWSCIPDFHGAGLAALQLTTLPAWHAAQVIKCNPDRAQAPLRLLALQQGKRVYTPVPELVKEFPYLCLDPLVLAHNGVALDHVMYSEGALQHGRRCNFADIEPLDFCVVGCVAVTAAGGRTGKGAGFADLEQGLFRHYGVVVDDTPVATTVHDLQVVADAEVVMQSHDTPLNWIATPTRLIATQTMYPVPGPIEWSQLRPDQFDNIPFLRELQSQLCQT